MSPEAKTILNRIASALGRRADVRAEQIRQEGKKAYDDGRTHDVRTSTDDFDRMQGFSPALRERILAVKDLIDEYGIGGDISWGELGLKGDESRTEIAEAVTSPKDKGRRVSGNYLPGYSGIVGLDLIKKDDQGNFVFNHPEEIALDILKPEKRGDDRIVNNAKRTYALTRSTLSADLLEESKKRGLNTMGDLAMRFLADEEEHLDPNMKKYYEYAFDNYSNMTPREFADRVLTRRLGSRGRLFGSEVKKK